MMQRALEGLPLDDIFIFDIHGHIEQSRVIHTAEYDAKGIIAKLDRMGVNAIALSSNPALQSDPWLGNDLTVQAAKENPGRIYAYVVPNPYYEDFDVTKYFDGTPGVIGIKMHACEQMTALNNPAYIPALEFANKNKLPILFHTWEPFEVEQAVAIGKTYKDAPVIIGHSGFTSFASKQIAIEACKSTENIFVDTAISSTYDGAIEWIVGQVGVDRVLFGTDLPFYDCSHNVGKLALSKLSDSDKIKIFGENAKKLLKDII
ncbi:MAG: amidohydrolase family protein [Clostridia bacterium]|nr:amidohydrolase family protein [Clostridia bacterium]